MHDDVAGRPHRLVVHASLHVRDGVIARPRVDKRLLRRASLQDRHRYWPAANARQTMECIVDRDGPAFLQRGGSILVVVEVTARLSSP